jgi:hypothetical protein
MVVYFTHGRTPIKGIGPKRLLDKLMQSDLDTRVSLDVQPCQQLPSHRRGATFWTALALRDFDCARLQVGVLESNRASCRVLEKVGCRPEAQLLQQNFKDGEACDMWMYALLRTDYPAA